MGKGGSASAKGVDQLNGSASWAARAIKPAEKLEAREDFIWDTTDEPHASRRKEIMKAHPEVKQLFGHEWRSKYLCTFLLIIPQIFLSVYTVDFSWPTYLFVAYVFGATITQALFLAIHELAHNLFFKSPLHNRLFSMVANWPIGIPYTIPFRGYHLEHHKFQGVDGVDTDVPSYFEAQHIRGPLSKTAWACCQILTYALRPMFIKAQDITAMHVTNWAVQIAFDAAMLYAFGWRPLAYMVLCILLAGGLHPCAGHFISEHYVFPHLDEKQETYSYYGPLNWLTWNVGYHNEHHDFPSVPWSRLPLVTQIAPEFYSDLPQCYSWPGTVLRYIFDDAISPFSRVKKRRDEKAD